MGVPKATVDEDCLPKLWKHDIWCSGQVLPVESEPIAHGMQKAPHDQFGCRIFRADARHERAPALLGSIVDHRAYNPTQDHMFRMPGLAL